MDRAKKNMIKIKELSEFPFLEATVTFRGQSIKLENVLIDTGSAGTIFNVNKLETKGVKPEANDVTQTIQRVGGLKFVYTKNIDQISINDICGRTGLLKTQRAKTSAFFCVILLSKSFRFTVILTL
ncbi:aspartyl protease family protein [Bacillus sp. Marseille-P3661]|uniref:aspartyl protease family protein n=1 Tax=Bacillus sp. Marseille-P3661 TaxID=1936234 RepID=UPI00115728D5|nr:aspartyl protease family protein [Bacillus sp. Marseille-P3661]